MNKAHILLVEDDGILACCVQEMVTRMGYVVAGPLASGEEAVAFVAGNRVDLVLMDIELAGPMNGIMAAEAICQATDVPIVFLTGYSQDPLLEQAKIASPYGYLIKPVPERELTATLAMALHRHTLDQELKQSQRALVESELQYRTLADSGQALIWASGPDRLCTYFNKPWLRFTGRTLEQELGNGWTQGIHPEDFDRCVQTYVTAFDRREQFSMSYRLRNARGEYRWLKDDGTPGSTVPANSSAISAIASISATSNRRKQQQNKTKSAWKACCGLISIPPQIFRNCSTFPSRKQLLSPAAP